MKTAWIFWTETIAKKLTEALGIDVFPSEILPPPDPSMGDFSFACFRVSKEKKAANPAGLAKELAQKIEIKKTEFASVSAVGPYVNFSLRINDAVYRVVREVESSGETYGAATQKPEGKRLFEHANPNTHKEIHIGHTRLLVLGASLLNILRAYGSNVVSISYVNDVGTNVGKTLWWMVHHAKLDPRTLTEEAARTLLQSIRTEEQTSHYLGKLYTEATQYADEHMEAKEEISFVQQHLETRAGAWHMLWQETRRWCLDELRRICDELGVRIDQYYFESEVISRARELVDTLEKTETAVKSEGALLVDLEAQKLGVFLLRKTDGTLLYSAKDLALAEKKQADYPDATESVYLVDARQSLYFKQLFAVLCLIGHTQAFRHVGFEIVTLSEGVMSSRKGNIVTYDAFRDAVINEARKTVMERHPDWAEGRVTHASWAIGMAAMKFTLLKQDNDKQIVFDLKQSLAFEGATGPYCQYAATRLGSILKKAGNPVDAEQPLSRDFSHPTEKRLALTMAQFPDVVAHAAQEWKPSLVAQWCVNVSQRIHEYYRDVSVLDEKNSALREGRLRTVAAARSVLAKGLGLLGIVVPDEM